MEYLVTTALTYLVLVIVLAALFFLPGAALLTLSGTANYWLGLQRYVVAIGLSTAVYPVLFYAVRFFWPSASLGVGVLGTLLALCLAITLWGVWHDGLWRPTQLDGYEWVAVAILVLTFVSRLWLAAVYAYPAWSDSLHHTLLTQLVAEHGRLPTTLQPYFPNQLDMYHLGLYALSGTVAQLAAVSAHTALLWTAQCLNALCGIGVYLVLDKYVGRKGAVVALAVVCLFSPHPALWVNWGRFTQLSSLVLMLLVWVLTLESLQFGVMAEERPPAQTAWLVGLAALGTAALFFFHFRVAFFYLFLLLPSFGWLLWQARRAGKVGRTLGRLIGLGGASVVLVWPVLWAAGQLYFSTRMAQVVAPTPQTEQFVQNYYYFPLQTIPILVAPVWLLAMGGTAVLLGLLRRHWLIILCLFWTGGLIGLGNLYLLQIPALNVTNLGAILIMLYLPLGLVIGVAAEEIGTWLTGWLGQWVWPTAVALLLLASLPATYTRATSIEPYRHFVTPADLETVEWIQANVPPEALFAINTYLWLPRFAHGTDAGYWLPYLTGHHIITSSMLTDGLSAEYRQLVWQRTEATEALKHDLTAVDRLAELGVTHIYLGARGNFADAGLQRDFLLGSPRVELLYEGDGTAVLRIHPE